MIPIAGTVISDLKWEDLLMGIIFILTDMIIDAIWALVVKGDKILKFRIKLDVAAFARTAHVEAKDRLETRPRWQVVRPLIRTRLGIEF